MKIIRTIEPELKILNFRVHVLQIHTLALGDSLRNTQSNFQSITGCSPKSPIWGGYKTKIK